jgi:hypothetical protein
MDVVDSIGNMTTSTQISPKGTKLSDVPVEHVVIQNVVIKSSPDE